MISYSIFLLVLITLLCSSDRVSAQSRSSTLDAAYALFSVPPVPGGIARITLQQDDSEMPAVYYHERRVLVLRDQQQWVALVGIPLDTKPGLHTLHDPVRSVAYNFQVFNKQYETQYIRLKSNRRVNPDSHDMKRIGAESQRIRTVLATPWRAINKSPLPLSQPVQGRFSSPFGLRRYFNDQPRSPHKGLDIAAPQGTPVHAPADGIILDTGNYFFNGNSIFIDHGQGVLTFYCHLQDILVNAGDAVHHQQIIGTVGRTGRATGPHLHWGVSLNNTMIDPQLVMTSAMTQQ